MIAAAARTAVHTRADQRGKRSAHRVAALSEIDVRVGDARTESPVERAETALEALHA